MKNKFISLLLLSMIIALNAKKQIPSISPKQKEQSEIIFGQTGSFSGSFKTYGEIIRNAITACFNEVNDSGKLAGKKIRLESLNDKGKAYLAAKNIKQLYKENKIDMFLGCMGTRGILKILPMIKNGEIAMFFPWAGDKKLMSQDLVYQINGLGLTSPQTAKLIDHVINDLRIYKIAIFHSDGNFSKATTKNAVTQLNNLGIEPIQTASYNRFTMNIKKAANKLMEKDPKVVLCFASSMPTAKLISYFLEKGYFGTRFFGIDSTLFVGEILKNKGVKFEYTSSVPNPQNTNLKIVNEYLISLKKYFPDEIPNVLSLAYYIQAKIIVEAIKLIEGKITKEKIIKQIEKMQNFDLGGFEINFNPFTRYAFGNKIIMI